MTVKRESVLVRLDPSVKEHLVTQAKKNDRSASAEASRIVREHLQREAKPHPTEVP